MDREDIYQAITDQDDRVVQEAADYRPHRRRRVWVKPVAAVLAAAVLAGALKLVWPEHGDSDVGKNQTDNPGAGDLSAALLRRPEYPEQMQMPNMEDYLDGISPNDDANYEAAMDAYLKKAEEWIEDYQSRPSLSGEEAAALSPFLMENFSVFLQGEGNRLYSPMSMYMLLAMVAETAGGQTRDEILQVLGAADIQTLRTRTERLWSSHYSDDGFVSLQMSDSVWLDEGLPVNQETVDHLADSYYAFPFQGDLDSPGMNALLHQWLREQTKGFLQTEDISFPDQARLAMVSTLYFKAPWADKFSAEQTYPETFHTLDGEFECDFMHQDMQEQYYWGGQFGAVCKEMEAGYKMWIFLPDEGVSADALLEEAQVLELLRDSNSYSSQKNALIHLAMPKFDVSYDLKTETMTDCLRQLGVNALFDDADFSSLTQEEGLFVSQIEQKVRVVADEEGAEAAAVSSMMTMTDAEPSGDEINFLVDRPFVFAITAPSGLPLFVGVMESPAA